jgi:hypothetical protein
MNDITFDPITGQPVQKMQPQVDPLTGMPAQPMAAQVPNPAVYGKQQAMQTAQNIFGTQEQRQGTVAFMKGDLDKDGQLSSYEANRQSAIDKAMANK